MKIYLSKKNPENQEVRSLALWNGGFLVTTFSYDPNRNRINIRRKNCWRCFYVPVVLTTNGEQKKWVRYLGKKLKLFRLVNEEESSWSECKPLMTVTGCVLKERETHWGVITFGYQNLSIYSNEGKVRTFV